MKGNGDGWDMNGNGEGMNAFACAEGPKDSGCGCNSGAAGGCRPGGIQEELWAPKGLTAGKLFHGCVGQVVLLAGGGGGGEGVRLMVVALGEAEMSSICGPLLG